MNTKIHYLYRDADNYKVHNSCVIKGVLTPEQINVILSCCDAGEYFIPNQVGLPERKFEKFDPQVDHCWFELTLTRFWATGEPCLWITDPEQIGMPKMEFVGGHPDEYCIFLKNLTEAELAQITSLDGAPLDMKEERNDIE